MPFLARHTHTHPFNGAFSGTTQVSRYQKGKTNLDFTEARGATENARHENTGRSKMQGWKMRDMNLRHQNARVENARHEFSAPDCRGGKCET